MFNGRGLGEESSVREPDIQENEYGEGEEQPSEQ
jgi:hypothetical protein